MSDDEQMQSLFNQLRDQLQKAKYRDDWWRERHQAIEHLHERSPRLFAELVQLYRSTPGYRRGAE